LPLLAVLSACHASCGETSGPDPVVVVPPDAGAMPGSPQPFNNKRALQMRPGMRTVMPVNPIQGEN
jgi:hypothetical protein